jgi:hypothetical protein
MLRERRRVVQRAHPLCGFDVITIFRAFMTDNLKYWTSVVREAERELEAATTRAAISAAGKKLMDAKAQVTRLQAKVAAVEAWKGPSREGPAKVVTRSEPLQGLPRSTDEQLSS